MSSVQVSRMQKKAKSPPIETAVIEQCKNIKTVLILYVVNQIKIFT